MVQVQLIPIFGDKEQLMVGVSKRPTITLTQSNSHHNSIVLGRNSTTKINDGSLSRHLAKVSVSKRSKRVKLRIQKHPNTLMLRGQPMTQPVNSVVELHHLDRLALHGESYEYVVHIQKAQTTTLDENSSTTPQTAAAASLQHCNSSEELQQDASSIPQDDNNSHLKSMSDEVMCPVCMDIMVDATSLVPCGHALCEVCTRALKECPTCRQSIRHCIPARHLDNCISHMVQASCGNMELFSTDDVQAYWKRSKRKLQHVTTNNNECPRGQSKSHLSPARKRKRRVVSNQGTTIAGFASLPPPVLEDSASRPTAAVDLTTTTTTQTRSGHTLDDAICID